MGDQLTTNFELTLLREGGYSLKRRGCQGTYGVAVGMWRLSGPAITLLPSDEQGWLKENPVRTLHIRVLPKSPLLGAAPVVLVPEPSPAGLSDFATLGVEHVTCFRDIKVLQYESSVRADAER